MTNMKRELLFLVALLTVTLAWAQGPNGSGTYYKNANGQKGAALKTALFNIISDHDQIGYDGLWKAYETSDVDANGKIIDRYSNITHYDPRNDRAGNYQGEGDCYNREHSFPKSWFGGKVNPMYCDIVHVVPADGYVNNRRGNEPFGETTGDVYKSANGYSKFGKSTSAGYSGNVFEPADEWKGDFARIYLYMATCYENRILSWSACPIVSSSGTKTSPYVKWEMDVLLKWSKQDPVDAREIARNNAVQKLQGNRNPFVDYPGLEDYIWGSKQDVAFSYDNYDGTSTVDPGTDPGTDPVDPDPDPTDPDQPTTPTNATEATFIFNTDEGLKELGIAKPASNNGTNLSGKSYTKGNVTLTPAKGTGSTDVRVWNSGGKLTFRTYAGNSITFTAAKGYQIVSISSNSTSIAWSGTATSTVTLTPGKVKDATTITVKLKSLTPTTVDVTIGNSGYSTLYYSNLALTSPSGVQAFVYGVIGGELIQDEVTGTIAAGEPVVLKATPGTYTFTASDEAGTKRSDNELLGTDEETLLPAAEGYYYYMVSYDKNGENVGFYWGAENGGAFKNGAHRAYLKVAQTDAAGAKGWAFNGSTTGISAVPFAISTPHSATIYNLAGQRVSKSYRGIVIVNGKKMVRR